MELRVNDYIRTLDGISRVVECKNNRFVNEDGNVYFYNDMMCNPSPNIIDLIEVGDYVNGYYVEDIRRRYDDGIIVMLECATGSNYFQAPMYNEDIKSIVTKEQFENMSYKVGD